MSQKQPQTIYLKDYKPADFCIDHVALDFILEEEKTTVTSTLTMRRNPRAKTPEAPLVLNGEEMQLQSIKINGEQLSKKEYSVDDTHLTISNVPEEFSLETVVTIKPHENAALMGLYKSRDNFCTQCEAEGFRRITYFLDRPDVMSKFTTSITADQTKYPMLLSNGNLVKLESLDNNLHRVTWKDPSLKPCYLFALVAGDFDLLEDTFKTMSGRTVALKLYLEKGFADQGAYALESLKRAMKWDEDTYGREYDLDIYMIVAVSDFNMGAMENKGLNIFNTKYVLAKPETATDADYVAIEGVIGHEYFHNWSGNRVTCRDWFQITLKEGFTVFRDSTFTEDMTSAASARLDSANAVRNRQFLEDAGPLSHPIQPKSYMEINNFYTTTVYEKGAEVIRMIRTLIGRKNFRRGTDIYFAKYDGQAVTTEEFITSMEDASGKDLAQFRLWYDQAGTPLLTINSDYNAANKELTLNVTQSMPTHTGEKAYQPMHIPLLVGLVGPACNNLSTQLKEEDVPSISPRLLEITEREQSFTFKDVPENTVPSLLRKFSAPVKIKYPYSLEELAWLYQCDTDGFARWNAAQELVVRIVDQMTTKSNAQNEFTAPSLLIDTVQALLDNLHEDHEYLSHLLTLPSLNYLLSNVESKDVALVHQAREFIKQRLGTVLENDWLKHYQDLAQSGPYEFNMPAMGKRSLQHVCLQYLLAGQKPDYYALAYEHFKNANNMTSQMGALAALNNHDCPERVTALTEFYDRWNKEPLVVNKWLMMQASSVLPGTLDHVKSLVNHPAFDIHNPNNVYALICGFGANTARLHNSHGKGYEFIADQVLTIDPKNPQVAARVIQPLTRWEQFDVERGQQMKQQLYRIAEKAGLSPDIYEVVSKSLG